VSDLFYVINNYDNEQMVRVLESVTYDPLSPSLQPLLSCRDILF
jgi:hypothetical protein